MQYLLNACDEQRQTMVVFTLRESDVKKSAIDVVFDFIGADPNELSQDGIIPQGQIDDLRTLQSILFSKDAQGSFINESASIHVNGRELDPDSSMATAFAAAERDGVKYLRCDLTVIGAGIVGLATAHELLQRRPGLRIAIVDKEASIAFHQSGRNLEAVLAHHLNRQGALLQPLGDGLALHQFHH